MEAPLPHAAFVLVTPHHPIFLSQEKKERHKQQQSQDLLALRERQRAVARAHQQARVSLHAELSSEGVLTLASCCSLASRQL